MKVIFSRKGFDAENGGYASPILPDLRLVSLPIPWKTDEHKYSDLQLDSSRTYYDLMMGLKRTKTIKFSKERYELTQYTKCHLDPDINSGTINRTSIWRGLFGQMDGAQTHLVNENVAKDDLFLFFGWFKQTKFGKDERVVFDNKTQDLHVIFGYLQIDKIITVNIGTAIEEWMEYHPHASENYRENPTNTIYVARDKLKWNEDIHGYGIFKFNEKSLDEYGLVLTKETCSRSKWCLPPFFKNVHISCHSLDSWRPEGYFQSAKIGQEFVVADDPCVEKWAKKLIEKNRI